MAAIDFPASPTVNQLFTTANGISYRWTGVLWTAAVRGMTIGTTAPALPAPGQQWWNSATGVLMIWYDDGTTAQWVPAIPTVAAISLISTKFTASGTWTPNAKMIYARAQGWGAGGAGGSCASAATNGGNAAGGGAAGSWAKVTLTKVQAGASQTVTIGAAAAQPASGNVTGGVGGDTSLGTLLVAKGGSGGTGQPAAGNTGLGGLGVVAGNVGDETGPGMSGGSGGVSSLGGAAAPSAAAPTNCGGSAIPIGSGGRGLNSVTGQGNGEAAIGFASGGSGAMSYSTGVATRGGVGTGGYLFIEEFCLP